MSLLFLLDFNLRTLVFAQDNLAHMRLAYRGLLTEYPLCYGHWQKWAEHERRHQQPAAAAAIIAEALQVAPHVLELWQTAVARELEQPDVHRIRRFVSSFPLNCE